jgi:hypothetical protein
VLLLAVFFASYRAWLLGIAAAVLAGALVPAVTALGSRFVDAAIPQVPVSVTVELRDVSYVMTNGFGPTSLTPAAGHTIRLTIQATVPKTVVLRGLRAETVRRTDDSGNFVPHAGVIDPRPFEVLLDDDPPSVRANTAAEGARDFPFSVSDRDVEVFDLVPRINSGSVYWYLLLDWTCAGKQGTIRVGLKEQPFVTAGI